MGHVSPIDWIALLTLGIMLFGQRLAEAGRPLGRAVAELKRTFEDWAPGVSAETSILAAGLVVVFMAVAAWAAVMSALLVR